MKEAKKISPITSDDIIDLVLSENQIENYNIPHEELFYLRFGTRILGPVWAKNLNEFLDNHEHMLEENAEVRAFNATSWSSLYEHPRFSRRRPQVLNRHQLESDDELLILEHGIIKGPYTLSKIKKRLNQNKTLLTDMISRDGGLSWEKIYKFDVFERRESNASAPPTIPEGKITKDDVEKNIMNTQANTIINLYHARAKAPTPTPPPTQKKATIKEVDHSNVSWFSSKNIIYITIGIIALIVTLILFTDFSNSPEMDDEEVITEVKKQTNKKHQTKKTHQTKRAKTFNRSPNSQKRKKYSKAIFRKEKVSDDMKSSWVNSIANKDRDYEEDDETLDNTPYEQDPVRSKLSRRSLEEDRDDDYGEMDSEDTVQDTETRDVFLEKLQRAAEDSNMVIPD